MGVPHLVDRLPPEGFGPAGGAFLFSFGNFPCPEASEYCRLTVRDVRQMFVKPARRRLDSYSETAGCWRTGGSPWFTSSSPRRRRPWRFFSRRRSRRRPAAV